MMSGGRLAGALILSRFNRTLPPCYGAISTLAAQPLSPCRRSCMREDGTAEIFLARCARRNARRLYFAASQTSQTVYNDIDKTMLARLSTLEATGIYGAAYRIIDVSFVPVSALLWSSYPSFFRAGARGISASFEYASRFCCARWSTRAWSAAALLVPELCRIFLAQNIVRPRKPCAGFPCFRCLKPCIIFSLTR